MTFNKNGTKSDKSVDKRNKTENAKPDKPDKPEKLGKGLLGPNFISFRSASIKPNTWRPKYVYTTREEG